MQGQSHQTPLLVRNIRLAVYNARMLDGIRLLGRACHTIIATIRIGMRQLEMERSQNKEILT